jgi:antitoxin CptB
MLELDVLLGNFLEQAYLKLTPTDQELFTKLLDCNDQELFLWLTGKEPPVDPHLLTMVEKVREHARTHR